MNKRFGIFSAVVVAAALALSGCASSDSSTSEAASCEKADLALVTEGKLTIATGEPAYYPWIIDDAHPESVNAAATTTAEKIPLLFFTNFNVIS